MPCDRRSPPLQTKGGAPSSSFGQRRKIGKSKEQFGLTVARLLKFGEEHAGLALVFGEVGAEFLLEEGLFALGFEIETGIEKQKAQQVAELAVNHSSANDAEKYARVNGVTHATVEASANEFVIIFERDRAAPIGAERETGPERESNSQQSDDQASPPDSREIGKKAEMEPRKIERLTKKQPEADYQRQDMTDALKKSLAELGPFGGKGHEKPDGSENRPEPFGILQGSIWS